MWVDAIVNDKDYKSSVSGWELNTLWIITTFNIFNFMLLEMWLKYFDIYEINFIFNFAGKSFILGLLEIFLNIFAPVGFINYIAIFYRDRYKKLVIKYPDYNGKFVLSYMFASVFLLWATIIFMW